MFEQPLLQHGLLNTLPQLPPPALHQASQERLSVGSGGNTQRAARMCNSNNVWHSIARHAAGFVRNTSRPARKLMPRHEDICSGVYHGPVCALQRANDTRARIHDRGCPYATTARHAQPARSTTGRSGGMEMGDSHVGSHGPPHARGEYTALNIRGHTPWHAPQSAAAPPAARAQRWSDVKMKRPLRYHGTRERLALCVCARRKAELART
jgi:hypothetical protein